MTTDFFTPVVDDPYDYGAIAAANSLSDVYAMGAEPFLALTIAALPPDLPLTVSMAIMQGLAEKTREAGAVIGGGHTIQDKEPKIGLVVLGFVDPARLLLKEGLQSGDRLVLTKPLGFGVTTTALKQEKAHPSDVEEVVGWMKRLNRDAARLSVSHGLQAATDVTGFGLLGHAWEMAAASGVGLRIDYGALPFLSGANSYASQWCFPGGAADNRLYYQQHVDFAPAISEANQMLLFDPQTSGGLLIGLSESKFQSWREDAVAQQIPFWVIGEVVPGERIWVNP